MIFFGHLGITTGVVRVYEKVFCKENQDIDYRFVLMGSVLPDVIDKPIGMFFLRNVFHNSRLFAHSLIFGVILAGIGIYKGRKGVFLLGVGSLIHQILDSMWLYPSISLWPFLGLKFPTRPEGSWVSDDMTRLVSNIKYYGPELFGFIIILYFFVKLVRNKGIKEFIKTGKIK